MLPAKTGLFGLVCMLLCVWSVGSTRYIIRDLLPINGWLSVSEAYSMNDLGQAVGQSIAHAPPVSTFHAAMWSKGEIIDLAPGRPWQSCAHDINNEEQVVGESVDPIVRVGHAILWDDSGMHDLGTLGGWGSCAFAINDGGEVVGRADTAGWQTHAFIWENGIMRDLGTLPGANGSIALDINGFGWAVGQSSFFGRQRACLWRDGRIEDLGTLPGDVQSTAVCVNDRGQILGGSSDTRGIYRTFLWEDGVMHDLGQIPGAAMNDVGQFVGRATIPGLGQVHAVLWQDGVLTDLGSLGDSSVACSINKAGLIVGETRPAPHWGNMHACLWIPLITVQVDVKPGDSENSINPRSKGVTPVAIMSTDEFEISALDPSSVVFAGTSPICWAFEDVDSDGDQDVVLFFRTEALIVAEGDTEVGLTGKACDGREIEGTDSIKIVGRAKPTE